MTVAALHRALEHLVVERLCELRFLFAVAAKAKLGLACFEHLVIGLLFDQCHRAALGYCVAFAGWAV